VSGQRTKFHSGLLAQLESHADAKRAQAQQAYMKSAMPFLGLTAPTQRSINGAYFSENQSLSDAQWRREILGLWRRAEYREERHAALDLLRSRYYNQYVTPELWGLLDELIVSGAWWDYIDTIAPNIHAQLLAQHPKPIKPLLQGYAGDDNMWRRRSAILCQLKAKEHTDERLLFAILSQSIDHPEFFVRKAMGWALRAHSRVAPKKVIAFIERHAGRLSPLTKREGLKLLLKTGDIDSIPTG